MIATIGVSVPLLNTLTPPDANAPTPICVAPNNAEALPAFLLKGASDNAAAFGLVNPRQAKKANSMTIVYPSPYHPAILPIKNTRETTTCPDSATRIIC